MHKIQQIKLRDQKKAKKTKVAPQPLTLPKIPNLKILEFQTDLKLSSPPKTIKYTLSKKHHPALTERQKPLKSQFDPMKDEISQFKSLKNHKRLKEISSQTYFARDSSLVKLNPQIQRQTVPSSPQKMSQQVSFCQKMLITNTFDFMKPKKFVYKDFIPREQALPSERLFDKVKVLTGEEEVVKIQPNILNQISKTNYKLLKKVLNQQIAEDALYRHGNYNLIFKLVSERELQEKKSLKLLRKNLAKEEQSSKLID